MLQHWRHARRCRRLAASTSQAVLRDYLEGCASQSIDHLANTPLISVDLELTGLDKSKDKIIAIGWTQLDEGRICIGSNQHLLINTDRSVGSSATIHELLDNEVAEGIDLAVGLEALFKAARGRVWIFHHALLDVAFLKAACESWAGVAPAFTVLDTMVIEHRRRTRRDVPVKQGDLQLSQLRSDYHLPRYTAHNALIDAFATAELMLAIASGIQANAPMKLGPQIKYF